MDDLIERIRKNIEPDIGEVAAAELARLADEVERLQRIVRDRQHPASEPRDPPECLRTLGFWPECGCGECYAIHCLDEQMNEVERLRTDAERWRLYCAWQNGEANPPTRWADYTFEERAYAVDDVVMAATKEAGNG